MPKKSDIKGSAKATGHSCVGVGSVDPGVPAKRGRGRQKGMPRPPGAGRKKGTPNRLTTIGRDFIIKKSMALPLLCDVSAGRKIKVPDPNNPRRMIKVYPTRGERIRAAGILAAMIVPNMKSIELSGPDGGAVALTLIDFLRGLPE